MLLLRSKLEGEPTNIQAISGSSDLFSELLSLRFKGAVSRRNDHEAVMCEITMNKAGASLQKTGNTWLFIRSVHFGLDGPHTGFQVFTESGFSPDTFSIIP
jgi:hypothetical protein